MNNHEFREILIKAGTTYEIFKKEWTDEITRQYSPLVRAWVFVKQVEFIKGAPPCAAITTVIQWKNTLQGKEYWQRVYNNLLTMEVDGGQK